jgi:hypothetical protein
MPVEIVYHPVRGPLLYLICVLTAESQHPPARDKSRRKGKKKPNANSQNGNSLSVSSVVRFDVRSI